MATVTVIKPQGETKSYRFDSWADADVFAMDYYTGLSYADGVETLVMVEEGQSIPASIELGHKGRSWSGR